MDTREVVIADGREMVSIAFGAERLEFDKIEEEDGVPETGQGSFTKVKSTAMYLLKNWKRIHADDRAMGVDGLSQDIAYLNSLGYSVVGVLSYGGKPGSADPRRYNARVRIVKDPRGPAVPS